MPLVVFIYCILDKVEKKLLRLNYDLIVGNEFGRTRHGRSDSFIEKWET